MYDFDEMEDFIILTYKCINDGYGKTNIKPSKGNWYITVKANTTNGKTVDESFICTSKEFKEFILSDLLILYQMIDKDINENDIFEELYGDGWFLNSLEDDEIKSITNIIIKGPDGNFDLGLINKDLARQLSTYVLKKENNLKYFDIEETLKKIYGERKER